MKLHSSLEPDLTRITKAFMKDGVAFLDDTGTRTIEQVEDIEYAMLEEIGPIADAYPTEITEYETAIGAVFAIWNPERVNDTQVSRLLNRTMTVK